MHSDLGSPSQAAQGPDEQCGTSSTRSRCHIALHLTNGEGGFFFTAGASAAVARTRASYARLNTAQLRGRLEFSVLAELPGILRWAIDGWDRLRQRGHFVQPATSAALRDELEELASPVAAWVRDRCARS